MQNYKVPYLGGKRLLAEQIIDMIVFHEVYVEVFGGGGGVLFKKARSAIEVYNDIDNRLVNLFEVLRDNGKEFKEKLRLTLISRAVFDYYKESVCGGYENLNKVEDRVLRAVYFWIVLSYSFSNKRFNFNIDKCSSKKMCASIDLIIERLQDVRVECLDYKELCKKYDKEYVFMYMDPPYQLADGKRHYTYGFAGKDFEELSITLGKIKRAKFILSLNYDKELVKLFKGFNIKQVKVQYSLNAYRERKVGKEMLITNYVV